MLFTAFPWPTTCVTAIQTPTWNAGGIRWAREAALEGRHRGFPGRLSRNSGRRTGITLSGGQGGQRAALGRALMVGRPLLRLDDALASRGTTTHRRRDSELESVNKNGGTARFS